MYRSRLVYKKDLTSALSEGTANSLFGSASLPILACYYQPLMRAFGPLDAYAT